MLKNTENIILTDFASFVRKAFFYDNGGQTLGDQPYIDYFCHVLSLVAKGETKRLLMNCPPRHLKTSVGAVYFSAWILANNPSAKIMVVTFSDRLAEHITYQIRRIMKAPWFQTVSKTRIAEDRSKVDDFATTQGGGVY